MHIGLLLVLGIAFALVACGEAEQATPAPVDSAEDSTVADTETEPEVDAGTDTEVDAGDSVFSESPA